MVPWTGGLLIFFFSSCLGISVSHIPAMPKELACSACWIVGRRYASLMAKTGENEETIQTGHRLNKENKVPRKKWKESELRAYEVTEQLCEKSFFTGYDIGEQDGKKFFTTGVSSRKDGDTSSLSKREVPGVMAKWCSEVLGEFEEDIERLVMKEAKAKEFRKVVCKKLSRACKNLESPFPPKAPAVSNETVTGTSSEEAASSAESPATPAEPPATPAEPPATSSEATASAASGSGAAVTDAETPPSRSEL